MAKKVIMPKFGMDQEEGTVVRWLKQEGDSVEKGEPILEVETDKVNMEVEASSTGVLSGITADPGVTVPVGQVIAYIAAPDETLPSLQTPPPSPAPTSVADEASTVALAEPRATPVAANMAAAHQVDLQVISTSGAQRITKADIEGYLNHQQTETNIIKAVPAARRLAREVGMDLREIVGSGPAGRIQSQDVRQARAAPKEEAHVAISQHTPEEIVDEPIAIRQTIPLTGMRRTIADRLTKTIREVPQFTVSVEVNMERAIDIVDDLRKMEGVPRVTLTAVLVKACARTLMRHPSINASYQTTGIIEWADINIGVAVAIETGLIVPVLHHADRMGLIDIAHQLIDVGIRAREGKLQAQDVQHSTFTISNLGMFGVDQFEAIINPPQAAILAVGKVMKRPIVVEEETILIKPITNFTLTADHRVIDGAIAGRFLADLKQAIEHPGMLM